MHTVRFAFNRRSAALVVASLAAVASATAPPGNGSNPCCTADLSGDGVVDGDDLGTLLGNWSAAGPGDLDDSGVVDGNDLGTLLGAWGPCPSKCSATTLVGFVARDGGIVVPGAVVISNMGGEGVTESDGSFEFVVQVPTGLNSTTVSAIATIDGVNYLGAVAVSPIKLGGATDCGTIIIAKNAGCDASWLPTFGGAPGVHGTLYSAVSFDDGTGPALFVGGSIAGTSAEFSPGVAKWNGSKWSPVGEGLTTTQWFESAVHALAVFDDGSGSALYAGGDFTNSGSEPMTGIARWNGKQWEPVVFGVNGVVRALVVHDDGFGPALYAGGSFTFAGGIPASNVVRWDGASWSSLADGLDGEVLALASYDEGSGPMLWAGGSFLFSGALPVNRLARWNGSSWSALGAGANDLVHAFESYDDGSGGTLIVGGNFSSIDGTPVNRIAAWNGVEWSALGAGVTGGSVRALQSIGEGGSSVLYATGFFDLAAGLAAERIARWDGESWSVLAGGLQEPQMIGGEGRGYALASFDDGLGRGERLIVAGRFTEAGSVGVNDVAAWDGASWSALGCGLGGAGSFEGVGSMTVWNDGSGAGPSLYIGGTFTSSCGVTLTNVAKWTAAGWQALGEGVGGAEGEIYAMVGHDDGAGGGSALYVGGRFTEAGGVAANKIARWNGREWSAVGGGFGTPASSGQVILALAECNLDGSKWLIAGGLFNTADGMPVSNLAKWDGAAWTALGDQPNNTVTSLIMFDDGDGPALLVGGAFTKIGAAAIKHVASWDGSTWSALGAGFSNGSVSCLRVHDDGRGDGPSLYAGGDFASYLGTPVNNIARWRDGTWEPLGDGTSNRVSSLASFDDGGGPALYAAGGFLSAGGSSAIHIARWDGRAWSSVGGDPLIFSFPSNLCVLQVINNGMQPPSLVFGGGFLIGPAGDGFIARYGCK